MDDHELRVQLRDGIARGGTTFALLAQDALTARLVQRLGFGACYVPGGVLGHSLAVSEALVTLDELATQVRNIRRRSDLPIVVDGGVGFGDAIQAARMIWDFESAGASAVELEDQVAPKRASHHRGIEHLVELEEMVGKIRCAADARRDPDFLIIGRTGAIGNEGYQAAIERCHAYLEAGADLAMLLPEDRQQLLSAPGDVEGPLATIAFADDLTPQEWQQAGWALVLDGVTGQAVTVAALTDAYERLASGRALDLSRDERMAMFKALPNAAGFDELYEIERATTEPGT